VSARAIQPTRLKMRCVRVRGWKCKRHAPPPRVASRNRHGHGTGGGSGRLRARAGQTSPSHHATDGLGREGGGAMRSAIRVFCSQQNFGGKRHLSLPLSLSLSSNARKPGKQRPGP